MPRSAGHRSYGRVLREIYLLDKLGSRPGLGRIGRALSILGNPQKDLRCVIVGGSNGKGSTVEMLGSILRAQDFRVGTYFSPHIVEFAERIRINGRNARLKSIARAYFEAKQACERGRVQLTFFEMATVMAFLVFKAEKIGIAVLEVGLGGRLDATNACEPEASAITSISLEHTDVLGKTIERIAHEKCGIARAGKPLVFGFLGSAARKAAKSECKALKAMAVFASDSVKVAGLRRKDGAYSFSAKFGKEMFDVRLSAKGRFQISNACVALACATLIGCKRRAIEAGLAKSSPAFRMQKLGSFPAVYADCAHNPEAASALASEIGRMRGVERKVLLFSAMKDKDYRLVLRLLGREIDLAIVTQVSLGRSAGLLELGKAARAAGMRVKGVKNPKKALAQAKKLAGKRGAVFIAGSIYLLAGLFGKDRAKIAQ